MERTQRIIELRQMFLELANIIIAELKNGKSHGELEEIKNTMSRISAELEKLEIERLEQNPILRNTK